MKKILAILFLGSPILLFSQEDKLESLCNSFCNELNKIDNLDTLSAENSKAFYEKTKLIQLKNWQEVSSLYDSLYKTNQYQFEELFRHRLIQVCQKFRIIENDVFSSNPELEYQQRRYHLVQKLVYSIEDNDIDTASVIALVGQNKSIDLFKYINKIDSIIQPIKEQSLLWFYTDRYSWRSGFEFRYYDLETKKTKLRVLIKFNPMSLHEIDSILIQDQDEIEKERKEMEKIHGTPPPPLIVEPKN